MSTKILANIKALVYNKLPENRGGFDNGTKQAINKPESSLVLDNELKVALDTVKKLSELEKDTDNTLSQDLRTQSIDTESKVLDQRIEELLRQVEQDEHALEESKPSGAKKITPLKVASAGGSFGHK